MADVSERSRSKLDASHRFNESTFQRKLDFFDTCFETNDDGDDDDYNDDDFNVTPTGQVRQAISITSTTHTTTNQRHHQGQQRKTATRSNNQMNRLNESTMDFLIEEEDVSERSRQRNSPNKTDESTTLNNTEHHDGALEALFASTPQTAARCKSVSSSNMMSSGQKQGRKSRISKIFTGRKSRGGGLQDLIPEEVEEDIMGRDTTTATTVVPLAMMGGMDKNSVKPSSSTDVTTSAPTTEPLSPNSDRQQQQPATKPASVRMHVKDHASGDVGETSERTDTTSSVTSAEEEKEENAGRRPRGTSPMPGTKPRGTSPMPGTKPRGTSPKPGTTRPRGTSPMPGTTKQRKGIRRKDLYGSRQNSGRRLMESSSSSSGALPRQNSGRRLMESSSGGLTRQNSGRKLAEGGGGEDDRRGGKRQPHQSRRQGSFRRLALDSDETGNAATTTTTITSDERRSPRKSHRRSQLSKSEHHPTEPAKNSSSRDGLGHQSDHCGRGKRRSSMEHVSSSGASAGNDSSRHTEASGSGSAKESSRTRTSENRGGSRRRPVDSLSQTEHIGESRRRSRSRTARSKNSSQRRSSSVGGGRRSSSVGGGRRAKTRSPECSRKPEPSRGRPSTGRRSDSARHLGGEGGGEEAPARRHQRTSVASASLSPKPKRASARPSSRRQLSSRDMGSSGGHGDSSSGGRRDAGRRGRRTRSSRNLGGSDDLKDTSPPRLPNRDTNSIGDDEPVLDHNKNDHHRRQQKSLSRPSSGASLNSHQGTSPTRTIPIMQELDSSARSFFGSSGGFSLGIARPGSTSKPDNSPKRSRASTGDIDNILHSMRRETKTSIAHQQAKSSRTLGACA